MTLGGQPHNMDTFTEYIWLKALETSGEPVVCAIGALIFPAYIDQVQVNPGPNGKWNSNRDFIEGIVTVKLISLAPIAGWGQSAVAPYEGGGGGDG